MLVTTFERISLYIAGVTPQEIGRCHKIFDSENKAYYAVENEHGQRGLDGELIEYAVRYSEQRGFTCTCPCGSHAFENVRSHPSKVCKHVRWVVATILEEQMALAELEAKKPAQEPEPQISQAQEPELLDWLNPANDTSYYYKTRTHLHISGGLEVSDRDYARIENAQPKEPSKKQKRTKKRSQPTLFNVER